MKNKLLNFTICQALIIIGMSLLCVKCQEQKLSATENVTLYDRSFQRVLSRRKRFLLWRPGSNILLTASLVKPLAFNRPTGHNLIIEWDIFYPLPSSWRVPKKPAKPAPPPPPPEIPILPVESHTPPSEVWQPEGGWTNDVIQQINDQNKNAADRRNWQPSIKQQQQTAPNQQFMDRRWNENNLFKSQPAPPPRVSLKLNPLLYKRPWQQTQFNRNDFNFNQRYFQSNRQLPLSSSSFSSAPKSFYIPSNLDKMQKLSRRTRSIDEEVSNRTKEIDEDWEHYYAHRDRRDLYERIMNASPMNSNFIRSCLLRTMCEVQHFLHPKGYSLLHDMLRIIFTVPIKDDMDDEYSTAMRAKDQDCLHFYSNECPNENKIKSFEMVLLHIKRGEASQFLYETTIQVDISKLALEVVTIYNGCLKVRRICAEIEELANYGCMLPPEMMGLTDEQIEELKLIDTWADTCTPSGGFNLTKDPVGRRNGHQPLPNMQEILRKAIADALEMIDKKLVSENKIMMQKNVKEALDLLRGAVTIVYPMQLPPHDSIRNEFQNTEDLSGTQASLEVIEPAKAQLWFAGKQMLPDKCLADFIGRNEKCKVIVKLQKSGEGAPGREPVFSEAERKQMMLHAYRRQEELKKIEQDDDDSYLNSSWSNNMNLKSQMHGIGDIKFRIGK